MTGFEIDCTDVGGGVLHLEADVGDGVGVEEGVVAEIEDAGVGGGLEELGVVADVPELVGALEDQEHGGGVVEHGLLDALAGQLVGLQVVYAVDEDRHREGNSR